MRYFFQNLKLRVLYYNIFIQNQSRCTLSVCKGSILKTNRIRLNQTKNPNEARKENIDFINQYYEHLTK